MIRSIRVSKNSKGESKYTVLYNTKEVKYVGKAPKSVAEFMQTHSFEHTSSGLIFR